MVFLWTFFLTTGPAPNTAEDSLFLAMQLNPKKKHYNLADVYMSIREAAIAKDSSK